MAWETKAFPQSGGRRYSLGILDEGDVFSSGYGAEYSEQQIRSKTGCSGPQKASQRLDQPLPSPSALI